MKGVVWNVVVIILAFAFIAVAIGFFLYLQPSIDGGIFTGFLKAIGRLFKITSV